MKDIRERILSLMRSEKYQPMNKSEFSRALDLQSPMRAGMRAALSKLERSGVIVEGKKGRYILTESVNRSVQKPARRKALRKSTGGLMVGVIRFQNGGNAWFYPDLKSEDNISAGLDVNQFDRVFVQSYDTGLALEGDRVSVMVKLSESAGHEPPSSKYKGKNFKGKKGGGDRRAMNRNKSRFDDEAKGKVKNVIERASNVILGTFRVQGKYRFVEPDFSGFQTSLDLVDGVMDALSGQRVVAELIRWESKSAAPVGRITKVLGWPEDPGVDIESVIAKHSLRAGFPGNVKDEAIALLASLQVGMLASNDEAESSVINISDKELERREDWRDQLVITVDPDDAKDFDDAIAVKALKGGGWELAVHIADVSHYIKPGSAMDEEAIKRGNSTYLVDRVLPMLPFQVSNNICSLRPAVDRLTKCAVMTFDENGIRTSSRFCDAVIHSKARLAYEQAQVLLGLPLENSEKINIPELGNDVIDGLKLAWELASVLRKKRFADGALDLEFAETKIILDDKLKAIDVVEVVYNESHQLIEECMLAANEAVAVALKMQRKNAIYRIHEDPDFDKLNEFAENARAQGYKVGDLTNKKHIQELLEYVKGTANEESIKIGLLKSLKRAAYSTDALGHYGLAKMDYCHFTSPIRRYADLVVHRALQSLLINPPEKPDRNPKLTDLAEIATHISDTERKSADAEMETKRMKMMEYLVSIQADSGGKIFTALVTDIRHVGLFVEISSMKVKGLVKVEDLPGESFDRWRMEGIRYVSSSGMEVKLGEKVKVQIVRVDLDRQMVDFRIVGNPQKSDRQ
jgi:ribonuclease R